MTSLILHLYNHANDSCGAVVDVVEIKFELPCNTWPTDPKLKRIGQYAYVDAYNGIRGIGWKLLRSTGLSAAEVEDLVLQFKRDSADETRRCYVPL